jgi:hypothetical protein
MKRSLVVLGILAASALLIPDDAAAQRPGAGFRGNAPSFRGGGAMMPRLPVGGPSRIGMAGPRGFGGPALAGRPAFRGGPIGVRPGGFRPALAPGFQRYGRVVNAGPRYGRGWGYPYYGGYYRRGWGYPYYGGALLAGLTLGGLSYPYYGYDDPYLYSGVAYESECYWVRRRIVDRWGRVVRRLVQVCEY